MARLVLACGQMVSHGSHALVTWRAAGRLDWVSAFALVATPVALGWLVPAAVRGDSGRRGRSVGGEVELGGLVGGDRGTAGRVGRTG